MPYSSLFKRKFRQYLFPKGVLFTTKKRHPGLLVSLEIMTGELVFSCKYVLGNYFLRKCTLTVTPGSR